jgi:hypothetical protein
LLAFGARDEVVVIRGALPYSFPTSPNSFVEGGGAAVGWYGPPPLRGGASGAEPDCLSLGHGLL